MKRLLAAGAAFAAAALPAFADHEGRTRPADHAPIGVMADHRHKQGEVMVSFRYMRMNMEGSRVGTSPISPETIATTVPNIFFGTPGQPPTLRVVPTRMPMDMYMGGVMYGLTDRVTLMAMGMYVEREMDHITFAGGMGTDVLGEFTTNSSGFGDTTVGAIVGLDDGSSPDFEANLSLSLSIPTGSITETDQVLAPNGMTPTLRLPYPMQLGSGTFDLKPGATVRRHFGDISLGGQLMGVIRLEDNDEGYNFGNKGEASVWAAYEAAPWVSFSGRLRGETLGRIDGIDPMIVAPVQTANPDFQGGEQLEALIGVNLLGTSGVLRGHRLAVEAGFPLVRDLNGPQLESDRTITVGWQKAF
ncbi:MAG: transporter [Pseudomonadota bacterium]